MMNAVSYCQERTVCNLTNVASYLYFNEPTASIRASYMKTPKILDFFIESGKLKHVQRTGWVRKGIANTESVADHSWRTALLALTLANAMKLDADKAVKMALVHDLAEVRTGDIQRGEMPKEQKGSLETKALQEMIAGIDKKNSKEIAKLCEEYNVAKTTVAKLVRDADNLDMMMQALEYEHAQNKDLNEFFENEFHFKETRELAKEIKARRAAFGL